MKFVFRAGSLLINYYGSDSSKLDLNRFFTIWSNFSISYSKTESKQEKTKIQKAKWQAEKQITKTIQESHQTTEDSHSEDEWNEI